MSETVKDSIAELVQSAFERAGIFAHVSVRRFPGETIVIVEVEEGDLSDAVTVASDLDDQVPNGFITVKKAAQQIHKPALLAASSLRDDRVNDLVELLSARSRTSEQQPSLRYVADATQRLSLGASRRHRLIFGRRGVGKTALMLEAKAAVEKRGATTFWINIQAMRSLSAYEAFLTTVARLCEIPSIVHGGRSRPPVSVARAADLLVRIRSQLNSRRISRTEVNRIIPELQSLLQLFCRETQDDLYLFLDDFHYLAMREQARFLDMIHSITRDSAIWIKAAGIKHQSRWFTDDPPTGLQTGHDATIINLDVTLERPEMAKEFLSNILRSYAEEAKLGSISAAISSDALDRLVLASGGVPRDFMILAATAVQVARKRSNARRAGVQDVNEAAGEIAQIKLQELEDDAASALGRASARKSALDHLQDELIAKKQVTYFRVDFQDKKNHPEEYELLQSLMDLRMIHLINASLSDEREAGHRSEVYMLDLSQFSGTRFRRNLTVLDFTKRYLVLKNTGGKTEPRPGDTPKRLLSILRRGPLFNLEDLRTAGGSA